MISYRTEGQGNETLILLHGFGEDNTCFDEQVLFFKDKYKLVLPDLPGFGKSAGMDVQTIDEMALELKKIVDFLAIDKCILIGHSMGGYVALAFAELFPQHLKGFGLLHSTAMADNEERKEKRLQVAAFVIDNGVEPYIRNFVPGLFAPEAKKPHIDKAIRAGNTASKEGIRNAALAMMKRPDRQNILRISEVPVFFGIGKKDVLIPEEQMFQQASLCKQSYIAYLENSAHMGMYEEAEKLNKELIGFIELCA